MKSTHLIITQNAAQLHLFETPLTSSKKWATADIWTTEWNKGIDLAIITACIGNWLQLKDMAGIAHEFGVPNENYPAFAYQVKHLAITGKLLERTNSKTKNAEWTAA